MWVTAGTGAGRVATLVGTWALAALVLAAPARGQLDLRIDECATGLHNCHADAECLDTEDAFTCTCAPGFGGDGVDCEECAAVEHSVEVSCNDPGLSTVIACAPGYYRTTRPGVSDSCEPRAPAPTPRPSPEPSPAEVEEKRQARRGAQQQSH
jgi:hypothetical protein